MIKAVFFDLDGTLLDTSKDLSGALNSVLQSHDLTPLPDSITRSEVSNGANALIKLGFGNLEAGELQQLRQELLDHYLQNIATRTTAFDGIANLIESLSNANIAWGIVTNKPALYTQTLMPLFTFASNPAVIICPEDVLKAKPDPEGLLKACDKVNCQPQNTVYIGDHRRDIQAGKNANMHTIAVGYGFTTTPNCHLEWEADYTVAHAREIWPIIQRLNS